MPSDRNRPPPVSARAVSPGIALRLRHQATLAGRARPALALRPLGSDRQPAQEYNDSRRTGIWCSACSAMRSATPPRRSARPSRIPQLVRARRGGRRALCRRLGYYSDPDRRWIQVTVSSPTFTPPDSVSDDTSVQFATIPADISFEELIAIVKSAIAEHVPLAEAVLQLKAAGFPDLPDPEDSLPGNPGRHGRKRPWPRSSRWTASAGSGSARWKLPNWSGVSSDARSPRRRRLSSASLNRRPWA
jgi:hypothetical protein